MFPHNLFSDLSSVVCAHLISFALSRPINLGCTLQLQSFLTCFLWKNAKSSVRQALSSASYLSKVAFFVKYKSVYRHSYHDSCIYCTPTVMAVLKYEFKISVTQSHKPNDMISRLLFMKVILKNKPVHKILNMVPVLKGH